MTRFELGDRVFNPRLNVYGTIAGVRNELWGEPTVYAIEEDNGNTRLSFKEFTFPANRCKEEVLIGEQVTHKWLNQEVSIITDVYVYGDKDHIFTDSDSIRRNESLGRYTYWHWTVCIKQPKSEYWKKGKYYQRDTLRTVKYKEPEPTFEFEFAVGDRIYNTVVMDHATVLDCVTSSTQYPYNFYEVEWENCNNVDYMLRICYPEFTDAPIEPTMSTENSEEQITINDEAEDIAGIVWQAALDTSNTYPSEFDWHQVRADAGYNNGGQLQIKHPDSSLALQVFINPTNLNVLADGDHVITVERKDPIEIEEPVDDGVSARYECCGSDCDDCTFLGRFGSYDLYHHNDGWLDCVYIYDGSQSNHHMDAYMSGVMPTPDSEAKLALAVAYARVKGIEEPRYTITSRMNVDNPEFLGTYHDYDLYAFDHKWGEKAVFYVKHYDSGWDNVTTHTKPEGSQQSYDNSSARALFVAADRYTQQLGKRE